MEHPHVLAIGLQSSGHNPFFLRWLAEGWAATPELGRLTLLVSAAFAHQNAANAHAISQADPARITLLPLSPQEEAHLRAAPRGLLSLPGVRPRTALRVRRWREWQLCRRYAAQTGADHALFINLDFYQFPATWNPDFPCAFSGIFHNLMLHYPSVFTVPLTSKQRVQAAFQSWAMRQFLARARAATLFCLDPYVVDTLNAWPGRHRAVALPTPAQRFEAGADSGLVETLRRRHGIDPARRVFLMMYGVSERRGIYQVLDALAKLELQEAQRVCLLVVGTQSDRVRLAQAIAATQSAVPVQIVTHDGFVAESEVSAYYALADAVLLLRQDHVGTSMTLVEAAAAGRPLIASAYGLVGEFTRRYGLGLTVDTHDPSAVTAALRTVLGHPPESLVDRTQAQPFVQANRVDDFIKTIQSNLCA